MHYDVVIIGAGMSGLAAGIRLAYFDKTVCILEKHYAYGGLNSYYTLDGREFDVGLHAVTNYVPKGVRNAPLPKLLRQLRLTRDDFDLQPQRFSEIRFPEKTLRFTNDLADLTENIASCFPRAVDSFRALCATIDEYDDVRLDVAYRSAREVLASSINDPMLIEMLLCPLMYYGSATEHDMDFTQFVTMFKSIFCQGFARPVGGVRPIIKALVRKFRMHGGKIRMQAGVQRINTRGGRVSGVTLENGETIEGDVVLSSAGFHETMRLCAEADGVRLGQEEDKEQIGGVSFVESIGVIDRRPAELDHGAAIVFFNDAPTFDYSVPGEDVDLRSGVFCVPGNYQGHENLADSALRLTWLANPVRWAKLDERCYREAKESLRGRFLDRVAEFVPEVADRMVQFDMFTPRTIERYTGHINGAVYGAPVKRRDGRTPIENLFICGTDQGFLGIIGAMLSGVTIANLQVLAPSLD